MNTIREPANRTFLPSEKDIMPPQNELANLVSGCPLVSPAPRHQKRTRSMKSNHGRRRTIPRPYLEAWYERHRSDPYPKKEVVSELAVKENLSIDQVKGWIGRRRKRMADASTSSISIPNSDMNLLPNCYPCTDTRAQALSNRGIIHDLREEELSSLEERETALSLAEKLEPLPSTSPIEQYAMTPPREECSTIQTPISVQNDGGLPRFTKRHTSRSNIRYRAVKGPAVSPQVIDRGTGTALGPSMSFSKNNTSSLHPSQDSSILSGGKSTLPNRQKGKRVAPQKPYAPERQAKKIFQCTRCNIGYQFRSDWARHMQIHEPQEHWTCMLQGETVVVQGKLACPFCDEFEPTEDHLIEHNVSQCADKTHEQRTFQRRDHILSHMHRTHESKVKNPPRAWMTVVHEDPNQQFWCGFCCEFLRKTWVLRLDHLADHFTVENLDMTKWVHERIYLPSVHPLNSTSPMNSFLLGSGSPISPPASAGPALCMSPAPPSSPPPPSSTSHFVDFDCPLDPYYTPGSGACIDPALLVRRSNPNDNPVPNSLA